MFQKKKFKLPLLLDFYCKSWPKVFHAELRLTVKSNFMKIKKLFKIILPWKIGPKLKKSYNMLRAKCLIKRWEYHTYQTNIKPDWKLRILPRARDTARNGIYSYFCPFLPFFALSFWISRFHTTRETPFTCATDPPNDRILKKEKYIS